MASFPTELTVKRGFMGRSTGRIAQEIYIIFPLSSHEGLGLFLLMDLQLQDFGYKDVNYVISFK
jgi:hypothetical protein